MKGGLLLDVVVRKGTSILKLLSSKDKTLLIWRNAFLVLNFLLHVLNGVRGLDLKGDSFASEGLDEDLHSSAEAQDQMKSGLLLDVVVSQGTAILELLSSEDQTLLIRGDTLLVLDFLLHVFDGVRGFDLEGDGLSGESFDEDLHSSTKAQDEVKGGLLLNVVVGKGAAILQLLSSKDQTLLVRGNALLVLECEFPMLT